MAATKQSAQVQLRKHLRGAKAWVTAAANDLRRNDRLDVLDAIAFAQKDLRKAKLAVERSLAKTMRGAQ